MSKKDSDEFYVCSCENPYKKDSFLYIFAIIFAVLFFTSLANQLIFNINSYSSKTFYSIVYDSLSIFHSSEFNYYDFILIVLLGMITGLMSFSITKSVINAIIILGLSILLQIAIGYIFNNGDFSYITVYNDILKNYYIIITYIISSLIGGVISYHKIKPEKIFVDIESDV